MEAAEAVLRWPGRFRRTGRRRSRWSRQLPQLQAQPAARRDLLEWRPVYFQRQPFAVRGQPEQNLGYDTNHYGLTIAGEPFIPKLTKPSSKDFVFVTLAGQHSTSPVNEYATVPTNPERMGNFSDLVGPTGAAIPIYNPATGQPFPNNIINTPLSPQALAVLNYLPAQNLPGSTQNYRLLTTSGTNTDNLGFRWNHSFGPSTGNIPAIARQFINTGTGLNQSINANFNYSHSASDDVNVFYQLGGKQQTHSYSLAAGYSIGKGRLTNNFNFTWNRNDSQLRNFFTNVEDVSTQVGILGPDGAPLNSDPINYGLSNFVFNQFTGINQQQPSFRLTQTFTLSESSAWRHGKHNVRFGGDFHRIQLDLINSGNATGTFYFTGFATQAPGSGTSNQVATSGSSFADFLLGIPQETTIQSPQEKAYMRQNIWNLYAQDDWRALSNLTILAGLRYEYFSPYAETNDRLATLDYNSGFTDVAAVYPNQIGSVSNVKYPGHSSTPSATISRRALASPGVLSKTPSSALDMASTTPSANTATSFRISPTSRRLPTCRTIRRSTPPASSLGSAAPPDRSPTASPAPSFHPTTPSTQTIGCPTSRSGTSTSSAPCRSPSS